jgi:hypothetical protein
VKHRNTTLDRIERAFAEAVAAGDHEAAEGWVATALFVADRQADRRPERKVARALRLS